MRIRRALVLPVGVLTLLGLVGLASPASAVATYTVNSAADDTDGMCQGLGLGDCTLREAITAANTTAGLGKIQFALGSGVPTINVGTALPDITDWVNINGATGGATRVELTGPAGPDPLYGLTLDGSGADGSIVRKLVINGFGGESSLGGGLLVAEADDTTLTGNYIGTDETGKAVAAEPNHFGIDLRASTGNLVGGATVGLRNVISGNSSIGLFLGGTHNTQILGNRIGTDLDGVLDLGNGVDGIQLGFAVNITIGTGNAGEGNVISGNTGDGIHLFSGSVNNNISGNTIGIGLDLNPLPNGENGIVIPDPDTLRNEIFNNRINHNTGLGIELYPGGRNPNDQLDADEGPNQLQNYPVITSAYALNNGTTRVAGRIRTSAGALIEIWVYANPQACDGFGDPEGQQPIGSVEVTADAQGRAQWVVQADVVPPPPGWAITATARSTQGSTSEFSPCVPMQP